VSSSAFDPSFARRTRSNDEELLLLWLLLLLLPLLLLLQPLLLLLRQLLLLLPLLPVVFDSAVWDVTSRFLLVDWSEKATRASIRGDIKKAMATLREA